jgi:hypothetical protein
MSLLERHEERWIPEPNTGCFLWMGAVGGRPSYWSPQVWHNGKSKNLARLVCEEAHGLPPTSKHQAAHNTPNGCVGSMCVNPQHLRWATGSENTLDVPFEARQEKLAKRWAGRRKYDLPRWISFYKNENTYRVMRMGKYLGSFVDLEDAVAALQKHLDEI